MWAQLKAVLVVGAFVVGVEWASVVSPAVAYAQPQPTVTGDKITCPRGDVVEVQYVQDSYDTNAYYLCEINAPPQRLRCPSGFNLNISRRPPACYPLTVHFPP